MDRSAVDYIRFVPEENKANLCVVCGECQEKCPQEIAIPDWLEKIQEEFSPSGG
jgi:predicted aldo/keto reductase-like oxidoreductase